MSSGGEVIVSVWFPDIGKHLEYFRIEYQWEEYPEQGNGWDDPGHGGAISIQSVEWLNTVNTNYGGITVHRELWDMCWYGDKMTLAERLEHEAIGQANEQYADDDFYDPDEWY